MDSIQAPLGEVLFLNKSDRAGCLLSQAKETPSSIPKFTFDTSSIPEEDEVDPSKCSDDEFFDANDEMPSELAVNHHLEAMSPSISVISFEGDPPEIEEDKDFRNINNVEGLFRSNKSMILQLLSQIRIGMDLTRFVLPAFIFEKRSLLEMYAEFFSHPEIIVRAASLDNPLDRMVEVTRWFLSSLSASRTVGVPKKPYNPVLGEVFCCYWDVPGGKRTPPNETAKRILESGPPILAGYDSVSFLAEQVSHHPPVTAFYAECPSKRVYLTSTVETKTRFQGLSVKVQNSGSYEVHFMDNNEVYSGTFPNGYVRSLLTTPWFEFGGPATITCKESGYTCHVDFHTKPFRGGQKHRVTADIRHTSKSKAILKLEGYWTGVISKKISKHLNLNPSLTKNKINACLDEVLLHLLTLCNQNSLPTTESFLDVKTMPTIRKKVNKFSLQEPYESRVIWRHLTAALEREDSEAASIAKHEVEEDQREKAREFKLTGLVWEAKDGSCVVSCNNFSSHTVADSNTSEHFNHGMKNNAPFWTYKNKLKDRIESLH